jgi:F-type H+-transporting ATPase subunit alpha
MAVEHQIAVLYCGTKGLMKDIAIDDVLEFEKQLIATLEGSEVLDSLRKGIINDEISQKIEKAAAQVVAQLKK